MEIRRVGTEIRKSYIRVERVFRSYTDKPVKRGSEKEIVREGREGEILNILV